MLLLSKNLWCCLKAPTSFILNVLLLGIRSTDLFRFGSSVLSSPTPARGTGTLSPAVPFPLHLGLLIRFVIPCLVTKRALLFISRNPGSSSSYLVALLWSLDVMTGMVYIGNNEQPDNDRDSSATYYITKQRYQVVMARKRRQDIICRMSNSNKSVETGWKGRIGLPKNFPLFSYLMVNKVGTWQRERQSKRTSSDYYSQC